MGFRYFFDAIFKVYFPKLIVIISVEIYALFMRLSNFNVNLLVIFFIKNVYRDKLKLRLKENY